MADELLVTQGKKMRAMREEGIILTFPSGNNYRVRLVGAAALLKRGNLPNILISFIHDVLYEGDPGGKKYEAFIAPSESSERDLELLASFEVVCEAMFMEPKIVKSPSADDEISIDELSVTDQAWAFWLAFLEVKALEFFRQQQAPDVVSVDEPQDVPSEAEQHA